MSNQTKREWSLLTPHGHALARICAAPDIRIRELAAGIGVTERAVHRIVNELEDAGLVSHTRIGRRNHYEVHLDRSPEHPLERDLDVREVVAVVADTIERERV